MSLTIQQYEIIYKLNTNVTRMVGDVAYDIDGNEVSYDLLAVNAYIDANKYKDQRAKEYPPITDYLDGIVKGDEEQVNAYIAACQAVKNKYPKPE